MKKYITILLTFLLLTCYSLPIALERESRDLGQACLASAVYYEARGESLKGQRAVVDVVMHRAYKSDKTFCEILRQKQQFQWTKTKPMRYDRATIEQLDIVLRQPKVLKNENYLFFHAAYVQPKWADRMSCKKIDKMMYCKEKV